MKITALNVAVDPEKISVSWELCDAEQDAYDLFLVEQGSVISRVRQTSGTTVCELYTVVKPMKEYAVVLTVQNLGSLSTARAAFCTGKEIQLKQNIHYEKK